MLHRLIDHEGGLGAVTSPQFLHDIAQVNLDCALAHVQFVGDDFIRLPSSDRLKHSELAVC